MVHHLVEHKRDGTSIYCSWKICQVCEAPTKKSSEELPAIIAHKYVATVYTVLLLYWMVVIMAYTVEPRLMDTTL